MGMKVGNVHIKSDDLEGVARKIDSLNLAYSAIIIEDENGWITILPEDEYDSSGDLSRILLETTGEFQTSGIGYYTFDDDYLTLLIASKGAIVDRYYSEAGSPDDDYFQNKRDNWTGNPAVTSSVLNIDAEELNLIYGHARWKTLDKDEATGQRNYLFPAEAKGKIGQLVGVKYDNLGYNRFATDMFYDPASDTIKVKLIKGLSDGALFPFRWPKALYGVLSKDITMLESLTKSELDHIEPLMGFPPITLALALGYLDIVECLLANGADVNITFDGGMTPIHYTAKHGLKKAVEFLIERGAEVNGATETNSSPLHIAVVNGKKDVVELLIENSAKLNPVAFDGKTTPMDLALEYNKPEIASLLSSHGAKTGEELRKEAKEKE